MSKGIIENLEQQRAEEAWSCVDYVNREIDDPSFKKEYRSLAMRLPSLIITNGLGQTLAFLKAKGKGKDSKPEEKIYQDIDGWLSKSKKIKWTTKGELIERLIALNSSEFRFATYETLSFLTWLKRFADAVLPKEDEER